MSFKECAAIVAPIMMDKVRVLNVGQEMICLLESLSVAKVVGSEISKNVRTFEKSLRALRVRTLATMLPSKVPKGTQECKVMDRIVNHMQGVQLLMH